MSAARTEKLFFPRTASLLFFAALGIAQGMLLLHLSDHSFFWGDEGYSIQNQFYIGVGKYLVGKTSEGTVAPLFFLVQKVLIFLAPLPAWLGIDQVFWQRLISTFPAWAAVLFLSWLAFWPRQRLSFLFSAAIFIAVNGSATILLYAWQARPYGLWLLVSTLYSFYLWKLIFAEAPHKKARSWWPLYLQSALLVCCTPFGTMQMLSGAGLLFLLRPEFRRSRAFWAYTAWVALLFAYSSYCSRELSGYFFQWPTLVGFVPLVASHFRWWFVPLIGIVWWSGKFSRSDAAKFGLLLFTAVGMFSVQIFVFYRVQRETGFTISNRYFLYLLPTLLVPALLLLRKRALTKQLSPFMLAALGFLSIAISVHGAQKIAHAIKHSDPENYRTRTQTKLQALRALAEAEGKKCLCFDKGDLSGREDLFLALRVTNPAHSECGTYWATDGEKIKAATRSDGYSGVCR